MYWVYEQAADGDGDARQEEDDSQTPTDEELTYQENYTLVPLVNLSAIAAQWLRFEDEVHVSGYDGKNPC